MRSISFPVWKRKHRTFKAMFFYELLHYYIVYVSVDPYMRAYSLAEFKKFCEYASFAAVAGQPVNCCIVAAVYP